MSVVRCQGCDSYIDTDFDAEHFVDQSECCHPEEEHEHRKDSFGWGVVCGICDGSPYVEIDPEVVEAKERRHDSLGY